MNGIGFGIDIVADTLASSVTISCDLSQTLLFWTLWYVTFDISGDFIMIPPGHSASSIAPKSIHKPITSEYMTAHLSKAASLENNLDSRLIINIEVNSGFWFLWCWW